MYAFSVVLCKQTTAYEMRMSDWSSDVCSSDLPAYVRADADLGHAVEGLVDGSYFNSGQSCCGIERIYVDQAIYREFVERFVALTGQYVLGNPLHESTTLGPLVKPAAAEFVRGQIADAVAKGAKALLDPKTGRAPCRERVVQ